MDKDALIALIHDEEEKLKKAETASERLAYVNNIIQIKTHSQDNQLKNDIYVNVKTYITNYIGSLEERQFHYDDFNVNDILDIINLLNVEQQCRLLELCIRQIKSKGYENSAVFEAALAKANFLREWSNVRWTNSFKILYFGSLYNSMTICFTLIACFIYCFVIYLPAPDGFPSLFKLTYLPISKVFVLNHIANIILAIFDIQDDHFVEPMNIGGTILLVLSRIIFYLLVINILIEQFRKRIFN